MWLLKSMKLYESRGFYEIKVAMGDQERFTRFNIQRVPLDQVDLNRMVASMFYEHLNFITGIPSGGNSGGLKYKHVQQHEIYKENHQG